MTKTLEYDLIAIGGGTAGLVSAVGAAYLGARSAIVEKSALGGDCLWTGCVPSKALIASGRLAHAMRHAEGLGLRGASPAHAFASVAERMRAARAKVARHDDPEHIRAKGVAVHFGAARFVAPDTVEVGGVGRLRSKRFVLASGATAWAPPMPGLADVPYLTYETVFDLNELPRSLVVLGGGPVGLELAQAFSRLGSEVTVLEREPAVLPSEDAATSELVARSLEREGIGLRTGALASAVESRGCGVRVTLENGSAIDGDRLLVATGRRPATSGLGLERAGVRLDGASVVVDRHLRTSSDTVWAAGDVTGGPQFTHAAEAMAKAALRNALLPGGTSVDRKLIPRVTFTDPEVAHVGISHRAAEERGASVFEYAFEDLDRAIVDGETAGWVKVSADRRGRILAASIVGTGAGELLLPLVLACTHRLTLADIATTVFPYPTRAEAIKRTADGYQRSRLEGLGGHILKRVVSWLT